ncbi:glucosyltransferase domain-containing protein [Pseudomonas sp. H11T01]|uniref:glucosyltransferase domain-containing protein n=1 Tax=Pseudomonas sp. H11T01 TaxID=3402749 RepID=UPI003AC5FA15
MRVTSFLDKKLLGREVLMFFLIAAFVYIFPLMLADYYYIDDNWRSLAAGTAWAGQGRLFTELFYNALTFSSGAPNIFPLPLLIATFAMAHALTSLTMHYYKAPTVSCCFVLLPLWYTPFFLQNLSYQYDGPATTLSLVAVIYAITFHAKSALLQIVVPGLLIAMGVGLYQLSINVFLGLCCVELVRVVNEQASWEALRSLVKWKLAQLIVGGVIYYLAAYPLIIQERLPLLEWSVNGLIQVETNIGVLKSKIALLFQGGNFWLLWAVLLCAGAGAVRIGLNLFKRKESALKKITLSLMCLLTLPALLLLVSGAALIFRDFNEGARTLMGFSVLLVFLFYLSHLLLEAIHPRLGVLLAVPLLSMLSLSYAYGRVLNVQKEFATSALFSLEHDIASHQQLREAKRIYMSVTYSDHWLSGAAGSFELMPVLAYILNVDFFMLSENLPRVGITNVVTEKERRNATRVGYRGYPPVVDSKFYNIYLVGDYGFIVMKEPPRVR